MKIYRPVSVLAALSLLITFAVVAAAQNPDYRISAPYTYKNLSIFLIHGKDESKKGNVLTLQEAMERKLLVVYETSDVNQLEVENVSKELDVFIQSGDIVKGGKQDRILGVSIIVPARSGRAGLDSGRGRHPDTRRASETSKRASHASGGAGD